MTRSRDDEGGQNMIIVALSMAAMLAMTALILDGGSVFVQRRSTQNAADAAALAGARELCMGKGDPAILSCIQEYAIDRNGADNVDAWYIPGGEKVGQGTVPANATGVEVITETTLSTFFTNILGMSGFTTGTKSAAQCGQPQQLNNLWPLTVNWDDVFEFETSYQLLQNKTGPGGFGWLSWLGDPSARELKDNLLDPSRSGTWAIDDKVPSSPGAKGEDSDVRDGLRQWLDAPYEERHVTIPVYDQTEGSGDGMKYIIAGYAEFTIKGFDFGDAEDEHAGECDIADSAGGICGDFIRWVEGAAELSGSGSYGMSSVRLSQ